MVVVVRKEWEEEGGDDGGEIDKKGGSFSSNGKFVVCLEEDGCCSVDELSCPSSVSSWSGDFTADVDSVCGSMDCVCGRTTFSIHPKLSLPAVFLALLVFLLLLLGPSSPSSP